MLPNGKYPFVCINLQIATNDVDVNVHPTKKEVRYKNPNQIFNFIYSSIIDALSSYKKEEMRTNEIVIPFGNYNSHTQVTTQDNTKNETSDDDAVYISQESFSTLQETNQTSIKNIYSNQEKAYSTQKREYEIDIKQIDLKIQQTTVIEETFNIIGQYQNTYILFEENGELNIVDQHIADERYIFEKLQNEIQTKENGEIPSQLLLISDVLKLEQADVELIIENAEKLKRFGYGIEKISDTEIVFKKIPQVIAHIKVKDIIADILENLHGNLNNLEEKMLVTMSCKAAVKAGAELNLWQMEELIKNWKTTKLPYTCPHGRPILKTFAKKEIASFFHRNV